MKEKRERLLLHESTLTLSSLFREGGREEGRREGVSRDKIKYSAWVSLRGYDAKQA